MPLNYTRQDLPDGSAAFLIGTDSEAFAQRLQRAANGTGHQPTETPTPEQEDGNTDYRGQTDRGGPVTRFTNAFSPLSMGLLEAVGLAGHEIADAVQTRVNELYRTRFPVVEPVFERKCIECGIESEERVEACPECDGDVRPPDPEERRRAETLTESVNKEGQSLRDLAKACEFDQWFTGVPVIVIRYEYTIDDPGLVLRAVRKKLSPVFGDLYQAADDWALGEAIVDREPIELVKGDPKRIVPVVDENRRIGGYWWVCPRHRHDADYDPVRADGFCETCGARLEEVYFAEYGESTQDIEKYYFREEIITFPWAFPRLNGLDGLTPMHHVWLKQLIIEFQDSYAAAFYDPESDRLPNQFMILHTTNPDAWDEILAQARESAKEDEYDSPVFTMEYDSVANERPEVQVVDAMPDELLGQNGELKETLKKDIRQAIGISDVHDSDLAEAGGLNNEGLQLEVTDRQLATQIHDYTVGWLDTLAKRLGLEDHRYGYIPSTGPDAEELLQEIEAGIRAEEGGLDARLVGGKSEVADGEFDVPEPSPEAGPGGGMGLPMADEGGESDGASAHDYGPDAERKGGSGNPNAGVAQKVATVPDNAVNIQDPGEAPEGAQVVTGPRGGTYYVPGGGEVVDDEATQSLRENLPSEYDGSREANRQIEAAVESAMEGGASFEEVIETARDQIGGLTDEGEHVVTRSAYVNQTTEVSLAGQTVSASPVLRDAFEREMSSLHAAAVERLETEVEFGEFIAEDAESLFTAWREVREFSLLNSETYQLWSVAADETGNSNPPEDATESIDRGVSDVDRETVMIQKQHTEDVLREVFGDTVPVARGVSGDIATEIREQAEAGEPVEIEHRTLESWSTFPDHSEDFAGDDGIIIQTEVPVEEVWASSHTTPGLEDHENEIIVGKSGPETYGPEDIYTTDGSDMAALYERAGGN